MIDRKIVEKQILGRALRITIDNHESGGGGTVVSSVDLNHAIHMISDDEWLLRDAAAMNGALAVIHKDGTVRELTNDERTAWAHERSTISFASPPTPAFKVGAIDDNPVPFGDVSGPEPGPEADEPHSDETPRMGDETGADVAVKGDYDYVPHDFVDTAPVAHVDDPEHPSDETLGHEHTEAREPAPDRAFGNVDYIDDHAHEQHDEDHEHMSDGIPEHVAGTLRHMDENDGRGAE